MLSLDINIRSTSNAPAVIRRLAAADRKFLSWYGGALRKSIRRNVRKRKSTSKPDKGPTQWAGSNAGLRRVSYEVSKQGQSVIVGVIKFTGKQSTVGAVPGLMEEGGTSSRRFFFKIKSKSGGRPRLLMRVPTGTAKKLVSMVYHRKAKPRTVRYKARPFVGPAFEKLNASATKRYAKMIGKM